MSLHKTKLFLGFFVLFAYISIGIFGLFQFNHVSEAPMSNCPYLENGFSVCANNLDHVNNWLQFSNAVFPPLLILSILILGIILYFFNKEDFLNQKQYFYKWNYYLDNNKLYYSQNKVIRWLSLLENSPAFSRRA
jgi:hypothetical protein